MESEGAGIAAIAPLANRPNIHAGGTPHVPIAVEHIAQYFTKDDWQTCVPTIRTIGIVRRLEHEFYEIESLDKRTRIRVPLSRGTNRSVRVFNDRDWLCEAEKTREIRRNEKAKSTNKTISKLQMTKPSYPESISVTDPTILGDTRAKDGRVYMVLGKLQWANNAPIINVDRFIPVANVKTTWETFKLQYSVARRHVDQYKAHFEEIRKIVRRPEEKRALPYLSMGFT